MVPKNEMSAREAAEDGLLALVVGIALLAVLNVVAYLLTDVAPQYGYTLECCLGIKFIIGVALAAITAFSLACFLSAGFHLLYAFYYKILEVSE